MSPPSPLLHPGSATGGRSASAVPLPTVAPAVTRSASSTGTPLSASSSTDPAPAIETEGLTKFYGDVRGIEDLTLRVPRGELFGLLGPNGAGKTTLIRLLLGLLEPTDGGARVLGTDVADRDAFVGTRERVGYLPSDTALYDELTGRRVLDYFAALTGDDRREELLALFPVPLDRPVRTYSRGNKQKLAVVQAFMHSPALVVMDEPTSGLDPLVQQTLAGFLQRERDRGVTIVFSTHVLSEVRGLCDRVAIVRAGRLVAVEDVDTLLAQSGKVVEVRTRGAVDPVDFAFEGVIDASVTDEGTLRLVLSGNYDALIDALDGYGIEELDVRETAVEDVFMHFYEDAPGDEGETGGADGTGTGGSGDGIGSDGATGTSTVDRLLDGLRRLLGRDGRGRVPDTEPDPDTGAEDGGAEDDDV